MLLNHREQGQGQPLVILHGLFGTLDNWQTLARRWAEAGHRVISVDLRNHGRSFHTPEHSYELMSQDLLELFDNLQLEGANTSLLGHSMGGKVAMRFALDHPGRLARLVVLDIAPRLSDMMHQDNIIEGLNAVNLASIETRQQADDALAQHIRQPTVRQFLLKNLYRTEDNSFAWRQNLSALTEHIVTIGAEITAPQPFLRPALFLRGGKSDYVTTEDKLYGIPALFPNSQVETLVDAGHWLHAEAPDEVFGMVDAFIKS